MSKWSFFWLGFMGFALGYNLSSALNYLFEGRYEAAIFIGALVLITLPFVAYYFWRAWQDYFISIMDTYLDSADNVIDFLNGKITLERYREHNATLVRQVKRAQRRFPWSKVKD